MHTSPWPPLPYEDWKDTCATLHLWTQVIGKVALALSPPLNHSWGVALHLTSRGLSTLPLPHGPRTFTMEFDFLDHVLWVRTSDDDTRSIQLRPQSVADFYHQTMALLSEMSLPVTIWPVAVELPVAIRLDTDQTHRSYEPEAVLHFWRLLTSVARVFNSSRCAFVGKCSPVHFFWGSFDLAVTRFSGRLAPPREGPAFMREAYSHEVISHGFWPGSGLVLEPAFYSYAVPEPTALRNARVRPEAAYYHRELGEFILPYDAVRTSPLPEATLRAFVESTYEAAATLGEWDRATLERRAEPAADALP